MRTIWKILIALVLLAAAAVGGFLWFMGHAKRTLTPRIETFLQATSKGQWDAAYDICSPEFQSTYTRGRFRATFEELLGPLGAFQRMGDVSGFAMSSTSGEGTTGSLDADVVFEKATVPGSFAFKKIDDVWRLQNLELKGVDKLVPQPDPAALEPAGRALLTAFDAGDYERMHAVFVASLQDDLPVATLKDRFTAVHEACASFGSPALKGTEDKDGAKEVTFEGTCPDGVRATSVQLWRWRGAAWKLQNIRITKDATEEPTPDPTPE